MVGEKKTAADYFPFFLGFSLSCSAIFLLRCKASWVNVGVCVCACVCVKGGREAVLMWRLGVGLNKR